MLSMPKEYKQSMHDNTKRRNQSHMLVTIGVINQVAQKDCVVAEEQGAEYSFLSNLVRPLNNYDVELEYATMEHNWFKADGSMLLPPRPDNAEYLFNQGILSEKVLGSVCFRFGAPYDIRGLTIDFGRNYPVDFTVSNGTKTVEYKGNDKDYWTTEEIFESTEYLLITPVTMVNGQGRLRIRKILMGIGISFENKKIKSSSKVETVSPIMEELPTLDFTLTVDNRNRMFDVENKDSAVHYLEVGQEVTVRYGYEITDGGDITWMDGCVCRLSDWEADDSEMSFSAKDRIDALDGTYYRGLYRPDGISLYALAVDVLTDAGLDERYYKLDEYLKNVIVRNPLPCVTHKECLQMISNAGRCKLYTDRQGLIRIQAAFVTVISPERMQVTSEDATDWSDLPSVVNGSVKYEYATLSKNHFRGDGKMYFLPRTGSYLPAGFVSEEVSDSNGNFMSNPKITIILEAATTYYGLKFNFSSSPALGVTIHTYYEGGLQESYVVPGPFSSSNDISHEFPMFDTITFEFTKGQPNSRIFLESVSFGDVTDYRMDYKVMTKYPNGHQKEKVAKVNVVRTIYGLSEEVENITQETIDTTDMDTYTFYFSDPIYGVVVTAGSKALNILDFSSYMVTVDISSLSGQQEISVDGHVYRKITREFTRKIGVTGKLERWENPLIDSEAHADILSEWLGNYFSNNIEYDISYRGEPRLDSGDIIFLENKYVPGLQIQLYEHKLDFNGALSGTVKARRSVPQE